MKHCSKDILTSITNALSGFRDTVYLQDIIHVLTKLRNRFLKTTANLPMGSFDVSVAHLKVLINTDDKFNHGLVRSDICPDDRQNFRSLQKCYDDRVINALKLHVPGSEATVMYLNLCKKIHSAFLDKDLTPCERLKKIWHAAYFFRAWRLWALKNYKQINFITDEAYACIELNANGLIQLIKKMREAKSPEKFLPFLFTSQTCKEHFRMLRSMTSINWTRINWTRR